MTFNLTIKMDNEAFDDDLYVELQRLLERVKTGLVYQCREAELYDVNGNKVGEYMIIGRPR